MAAEKNFPKGEGVLDLFCGAGGSAMGLSRAGFKRIVGVDIKPQPEYPFEFIQGDAQIMGPKLLQEDFDFIWASPPCQAYSPLRNMHGAEYKEKHKEMLPEVRGMLKESGKPFVIENVPSAPIRRDLMLCGTMFDLKVFRHRFFEIEGFFVWQPYHMKHDGTTDSHRWPYKPINGYVQVTGNGMFTIKQGQAAMGIDHITRKKSLAEAIPPAYSEYIGRQFMNFYRYERKNAGNARA